MSDTGMQRPDSILALRKEEVPHNSDRNGNLDTVQLSKKRELRHDSEAGNEKFDTIQATRKREP
jgi:hypothetical protein